MEQDKGVKVGVVGREGSGGVQGVVVFDKGGDFELMADPVFDDSTKWVFGRSFGQGEFAVAVGHGFGADEDEVEFGAGEHVRELDPDITWQGGFGAGAEDEETGWRGTRAETGNVETRAIAGWVEGVAEGWVSLLILGCWVGRDKGMYRLNFSALQRSDVHRGG